MTDEIVLRFAFIVLRFYRSDGAINRDLKNFAVLGRICKSLRYCLEIFKCLLPFSEFYDTISK